MQGISVIDSSEDGIYLDLGASLSSWRMMRGGSSAVKSRQSQKVIRDLLIFFD